MGIENPCERRNPIVLLMGVSGSGKSTIGRLLADALKCEFIDGDDHHPVSNIAKMSAGIPLEDEDRIPWLQNLAGMMRQAVVENNAAVVACSGLKRRYREMLRVDPCVVEVLLYCAEEVIRQRMGERTHWFDPALLRSQFETLEMPTRDESILVVDVGKPAEAVVTEIRRHLRAAAP